MAPPRTAYHLLIVLLALALLLYFLSGDSCQGRLTSFFQLIKTGLSEFEYLPAP